MTRRGFPPWIVPFLHDTYSLPVLVLATSCLLRAEIWPQFRGPDGSATAAVGSDVPMEWSARKNVRWRTPLPGPGSSSPVFWEDRLFVTCYTGYGTNQEEIGEPADLGRTLLCLDRKSGKILWKESVERGESG